MDFDAVEYPPSPEAQSQVDVMRETGMEISE
jgi:hypothetical protein